MSHRHVFAIGLLALAACGDRPAVYDDTPTNIQVVGTSNAIAIFDPGASRAVFVSPRSDLSVSRTSVAIHHGVVATATSIDQSELFVLSSGDTGKRTSDLQNPSLAAITPKNGALTVTQFPLESPLSQLAVDPLGRYVAAYAGNGASFVENPNEIVILDLSAPDPTSALTTRTIRSFGGKPQRLTFTQELQLPGGPRRLLVIETEEDVTVLDLDHVHDDPPRPEITIPLTDGTSTVQVSPGGVVVDDGDPARTDDARIAVRLTNDTNVVTLSILPPSADAPATPNDFRIVPNKADVGGIASDIAFVHTDGGLRIAALVPSLSRAVLIDPQTSVLTNVDLPAAYTSISLVTSIVGAGGNATDVALLYGASSSSGVAFWALGTTSGKPYRSVEVVNVNAAISEVLDVSPPNQVLKILESKDGSGFYVLDLSARTAQPLDTKTLAALFTSADGQRLWAYQKGGSSLARVTLSNLHVDVLPDLGRRIDFAFEATRDDGGHALMTVDARGGVGVTVLDADNPDVNGAKAIGGLLLEGLE